MLQGYGGDDLVFLFPLLRSSLSEHRRESWNEREKRSNKAE